MYNGAMKIIKLLNFLTLFINGINLGIYQAHNIIKFVSYESLYAEL